MNGVSSVLDRFGNTAANLFGDPHQFIDVVYTGQQDHHLVASDAAHLYMNFRQAVPYPTVYDVAGMLEGFRTVQRLADSPEHVVPGHDPMVMQLYPAVSKELEGIAIRIDVPPRAPA